MPISELRVVAQQHFQRRLKLTSKGWQLDLRATLSEAGLQNEDMVDAVVQLGKLTATLKSFALHEHGGEVVAWGDAECGGDSSQVQEQLRDARRIYATGGAFAVEQLRNVQHIQATAGGAFAAILASGTVVTWGQARRGGDSSRV